MDVKLYNVLTLMKVDDTHLKSIVEYTLLVFAMNLKGLKIRRNPFEKLKNSIFNEITGKYELLEYNETYYFTYDIYYLIEDYIGAILFVENDRFDITKNFLYLYKNLERFLMTIEKYISDDTYEDLKPLTIEDVYNDKNSFIISYNNRFNNDIQDDFYHFELIINKFQYLNISNIIKFIRFIENDYIEEDTEVNVESPEDMVNQIRENNLRVHIYKNNYSWSPSYYINTSLSHHIFLKKIMDSIEKSTLITNVEDYIYDLDNKFSL